MIRKITAYIIAAVCLCCFEYLRNYPGDLISHPKVWAILSLVIGLLAAYIGFTTKPKKIIKQEADTKDKINRLKQNGKKIIVSLDDCEIKENNYSEDVIENWNRVQSIDSLYDPNKNIEKKEIDQSVIVYYYQQGVSKYKLISQVFSHDAVSLSVLIENKQVALYINPGDVRDYIFELND